MKAQPGRLVLLGHPVGHSLSPLLQNAALRAAGIPLVYEALDVPRSAVEDVVADLRRAAGAGNVTVPYKHAVVPLCDRLAEGARGVGAVNTFWTAVDGALVGDNTDADGFAAAAAQFLDGAVSGHAVAILGAGGAAAAVLHAMKGWRPRAVRLYSRTMSRARELTGRLWPSAELAASAADAVAGATLVVNATPVGMRSNELPVPPDALPPGCAVMDLVYAPAETAFVHAARARGLRATDGLTMLVEQGALAFARWFGQAPDREAMWRAVPQRR